MNDVHRLRTVRLIHQAFEAPEPGRDRYVVRLLKLPQPLFKLNVFRP